MSGARALVAPDRFTAARRELVLAAVTVLALSRFADGPLVWVVAALLGLAVVLGVRAVLAIVIRSGEARQVPAESLIVPAVAALAAVGAIRLVPLGVVVAIALLAAALVLDWSIRVEGRLLTLAPGAELDRTPLLVAMLLVAFAAFTGVAALVPGGLPEPGDPAAAIPMSEADLVVLAGVDALVAGLLGFRASTLRSAARRDALWSAATYASAIAIAAAALRAMDIPRLVGPGLLTLVFFLWDGFHGASPARRRDPRWVWQTVLLLALGGIVIAWNIGLR